MKSMETVQAVAAYELTTGRLIGSVAALLSLAGVIVGAIALARPNAKRAMIGLGAGLAGIAIGIGVVAMAKGGPGTGYGIVGGYAAIGIGVIAVAVSWPALTRSRRVNPTG